MKKAHQTQGNTIVMNQGLGGGVTVFKEAKARYFIKQDQDLLDFFKRTIIPMEKTQSEEDLPCPVLFSRSSSKNIYSLSLTYTRKYAWMHDNVNV